MTWNNMLPALRDPRVQLSAPETPRTTGDLLAQITDPYGVYCVLELNTGETDSIFHLFPVMPESLAISQRYLQTITPTQGGVFVDEYGRAPSPIMLSGTFGRSPKLAIASGQEALLYNADRLSTRLANTFNSTDFSAPYQSDQPVTGYKLVKLLSEMVDLSHTPDPKTGNLPKAFFYNFAFGQFYEVALSGFQAQMDVERNGIWFYQLEMVMLRRINAGYIDSIPGLVYGAEPTEVYKRSQKLVADRLKEMQQTVQPATERASRQASFLSEANRLRLQTAFDTVQRGRELISRTDGFITALRGIDILEYGASALDKTLNLTPGTVIRFYDTVRQLPRTSQELQSIWSQSTRRLLPETWNELVLARRSVQEVQPAVDRFLNTTNARQGGPITTPASAVATVLYPAEMDQIVALGETALWAAEQLDAIDVMLNLYGFTDAPSASSSVVLSQPPVESMGPGSSSYIIRQGDTLLGIAQREYGAESAWTLVASALSPLYDGVASTESLNAFIGRVIQLPAINSGPAPLVPYVWAAPNGVEALGRDLPDELQVVTRSDGYTDLVILSEFETLLQGLIHRLQTPLGAIPDDQTFGSAIPAIIGQDFGALSNAMNEAKITEALRKDSRLTTVTGVTALQDQDNLEIGFTATARNAGSLGNVNLSISRQTP
jgi:nucleoid-associated protein YgaU